MFGRREPFMRSALVATLVVVACVPAPQATRDASVTEKPDTGADAPDLPDASSSDGGGADGPLVVEPRQVVHDPASGREKWECILDFNYVNPHSKATAALIFRNGGANDIDVSGISVEQDPSKGDAFSIEALEPLGALTIPAGGSSRLPLSFLPTTLGLHNGKLVFLTTDTDRQSGYCLLRGTGGGPVIATEPESSIDFGSVAGGTFVRQRLTVSNVGTDVQGTTDDNLKLVAEDTDATSCANISDCPSGHTCQRGSCWSEQEIELHDESGAFAIEWPPEGFQAKGIAAGMSVDVKIKFAPSSLGEKTATLNIYSNDPSRPVAAVSLRGTGRALIECGGLVEGAACVDADWTGFQCFNGNCYFDCASACWCAAGTWSCSVEACRSMQGQYSDGGMVPCGQSPKCWAMCGVAP